MKNILISVPIARIVRYFVETQLFEDIMAYCEKNNINVYVLHKQTTLTNFFAEYNNISELRYPEITKTSKLANIFRQNIDAPSIIRRHLLYGRFPYWRFSSRESLLSKIKKIIILPFILFIYNIPFWGKERLRKLFHDENYIRFFTEYNFNAVILNLPADCEERIIAQTCNELDIPVIIGSDGWDVYLNYGFIHKYDGAMVWGPEMGKHAKELGFSDNQLIYTGIPHKDKIQHFMKNIDAKKVREKYQISENDKVILLPCNRWYQTNDMEKNFISKLLQFIESDTAHSYIIILRSNPGGIPRKEDIDYTALYSNNKMIRFQKPAEYFQDGWKGNIDNNIMYEVAELFAVSNCIFSITSLFMLEAASVNIPIALYNIKKEKYNVRSVTKSGFYKNLLKSGIPELTDFDDIPEMLNFLLDDSSKEYLNSFVSLYDYREANYIDKLFQLLQLEQ